MSVFVCMCMYLHAGHEILLLSFVEQLVDIVELQQGLCYRRSLCFIGHVVQQVENMLE